MQYGYHVCYKQELLSYFKAFQWGHLVFDRKRLEPREFPWQQHYGYYLVSFVMNISGVKFKKTAFIFPEIFFIQYFTTLVAHLMTLWRHHVPNFHNRKTSISQKRKKIFQKGKGHYYFFLKSLSNKLQLFFMS